MSAAGEAAPSRPTRLGRYELITRIGQGGMAEVQLALQRGPAGFEKLVVVKLVHNSLASQKAFVDMLLDEARVAALVKHPNVVDIYDLGQADGRYFIAMEYLEGEPLLAVLRAGREGKRLDALSTGRLIADTAEGLDAAHELRSMSGERLELVHHDISLGNIVVLYNGQVKLVDFGVAKATQTQTGAKAKVQGKFSYMAPEKLKGATGDRRSDIFSLGCVMWEALTLKRLFRGGNDAETMKQVLELPIQPPSKVNGDVPPEYDAIVMRSLERDPDRRHGTAKEMAVEVEELLRKRGYGAKNDKVARYMQETFKAHIEARKKLVQEVVSKGHASAEVLDAAFSDPILASGSPVTPVAGTDFSVKYRRVTPPAGIPIVSPAWADASAATQISAPPIFDSGSTATEITPIPDEIGKGEGEGDGLGKGDGLGEEVAVTHPVGVAGLAHKVKALLADKTKRLYVAGGAAGLLLLVIIIAVASGGGGKKSAVADVIAKGSDTEKGSDAVVTPEGSGDEVPDVAPDAGTDEPDIIIDDTGSGAGSGSNVGSGRDPGKGSADRVPDIIIRQPPIDVPGTVNKATLAFVKGDAKGALALLQKAKAAKPNYAPTYRVLGKVHKKLGDKGAAKRAFQRYLQIAPNAVDAPLIRKELEEL